MNYCKIQPQGTKSEWRHDAKRKPCSTKLQANWQSDAKLWCNGPERTTTFDIISRLFTWPRTRKAEIWFHQKSGLYPRNRYISQQFCHRRVMVEQMNGSKVSGDEAQTAARLLIKVFGSDWALHNCGNILQRFSMSNQENSIEWCKINLSIYM